LSVLFPRMMFFTKVWVLIKRTPFFELAFVTRYRKVQSGAGFQHPAATLQSHISGPGFEKSASRAITYCVLSRCCSNEARRLLRRRWDAPYHRQECLWLYQRAPCLGQTERQQGICRRPGGSHVGLHTGIDFNIDESWMKEEIFKISERL